MLVTQEIGQHFYSHLPTDNRLGTVDIPTRSAPMARKAAVSLPEFHSWGQARRYNAFGQFDLEPLARLLRHLAVGFGIRL